MSLASKVAKNTLIQIVSKVISTILGIVALGIMTRALGKDGFGEYTAVFNFMSMFAIVADLGLTLITVQMISDPKQQEQRSLNNLIGLRLVSAIIFLSIGPISALFVPYSPAIKIGIFYSSFSFIFIALNQVLVGLFQKNLAMDKSAYAEIASRIFLVAGLALSYNFNWGLNGAIWSTVAGSAANFLLQWLFSKKFIRIKLEFDFKLWKEIIIKSWPLAVIIIFNLIYLKADTLILSFIRPEEEVGLYGAAYKIIEVLTALPYIFAGIVLPILTAAWHNQDKERFFGVMQKSLDLMIIMAVPIVIGAQFLAKDIMSLIAGPNFAPSGKILQILIMAAGLIFISCLLSHALIAANKQRKLIWAYVIVSFTALAGYLIFIPRFSYIGAAWTTIYSELAVTIFTAIYIRKELGGKANFKALIPAIKSCLPMIALLWLAHPLYEGSMIGLLIAVLLSIIAYAAGLYLFRGVTADDIKLVTGKA